MDKIIQKLEDVDFTIVSIQRINNIFLIFSSSAIYAYGAEEDIKKFKENGMGLSNE